MQSAQSAQSWRLPSPQLLGMRLTRWWRNRGPVPSGRASGVGGGLAGLAAAEIRVRVAERHGCPVITVVPDGGEGGAGSSGSDRGSGAGGSGGGADREGGAGASAGAREQGVFPGARSASGREQGVFADA